MSEYTENETDMKDKKALIAALIEMGWKENEIEICDKPKHLYGYQGDQRDELAHIIIRKQHVGGSSNDIGFRKEANGTYTPIISNFDRSSGGRCAKHTGGYNKKWEDNLRQKYAVSLAIRKAKRDGYTVKKVVEGEKIRLKCELR